MDKVMDNPQRREARLTVRDDLDLLPTVLNFIEKTALAFGLGETEALDLTLAGEEIFNYLCVSVKPKAEIEIDCYEGGYYAALNFTMPSHNFALKAFNLSATIDIEDDKSLDEMGLILASRMVDQLEINRPGKGHLQLSLRKEKNYPQVDKNDQSAGNPVNEDFSISPPDAAELKYFITRSHLCTAPETLPREFFYPGKIVDMVNSGDWQAAIARDRNSRIGGGIIWYWNSNKMVECLGPYILSQNSNPAMPHKLRQKIAEALLEHCLHELAKSPAVGLINCSPSPDLPLSHFETLGTVLEYQDDNLPAEIPALFRQMHEDPGAVAWAHPDLEPFLRNQYQHLTLPREIRLTSDSGESTSDSSVLTTEFDRSRGKVTLRPLWAGKDIDKNIADHLTLFAEEDLKNIFFVIDLGESWHCAFFPALMENGFTPRLILPYGGKGDLLVLQKTGEPA